MTEANPLRVLILDESVPDAELILVQLHRAGLQTESKRVDSPRDLRAALERELWDVVLSDYSMPQFDALDALRILKEVQPDVPFIVVAGSVGEPAAVAAMKAGAHDFFLKDNLARLPSAVARERREATVRRERKRAIEELRESQKELRQAVNARDEFLSIASHELKTPLTSLTLNVQSARNLVDRANPSAVPLGKLGARLDGAARQAARLAALINNLLEVTRITSGKLVPLRESLDLRDVVRFVVAGLREALRASSSELRVVAPAPVVGQWDRIGIESVTFNVISNAIKYGRGQPIDVELHEQKGLAHLVVTDRGIGIPRSDQERIFQRFERAVPHQHYGGFGLGLWISRQIVEAHGGTIAVASQQERGSVFTIVLPLLVPGEILPPGETAP